MISAKRHIPGFAFDPRDPQEPVVSFATVAELLEAPWVKAWREHPGFCRYSISRSYPHRPHLMVELDSGLEWYVLAYLSDDPALSELPEWRPVR